MACLFHTMALYIKYFGIVKKKLRYREKKLRYREKNFGMPVSHFDEILKTSVGLF
jgi:hypothetical protein